MGLLGKKIGMTRVYSTEGNSIGVTVVETGPCVVLQKKTMAKDGYNAIQIGFVSKKEQRMNKAAIGHAMKGGAGGFYHLKEFRTDNIDSYEVGQTIVLTDLFKAGDLVDISGNSKGRGFQGVVKRHGFHGGRKTHGSMFHRAPGSIGCSAWPSRVIKGKRLPGHMGDSLVTKKNAMIVDIMPDVNVLIIKGPIPGPNNGLLQIFAK